jgi:hypothetical protein
MILSGGASERAERGDMSEQDILQTVRDAPRESLPALIGVLARAQAEANARLQAPAPQLRQIDELISTSEAARRLGISKTLLYHKDFPFTVRDPQTRRLRFSARGIEKYIAEQTNNHR